MMISCWLAFLGTFFLECHKIRIFQSLLILSPHFPTTTTHGSRGAALRAVWPPHVTSGTPRSPALNRPRPRPRGHTACGLPAGVSRSASLFLCLSTSQRVPGPPPPVAESPRCTGRPPWAGSPSRRWAPAGVANGAVWGPVSISLGFGS